MADIIKTILSKLPDAKLIDSAYFEGANIILYTHDKKFLVEGEPIIKQIVNEIKKRIELRAVPEILVNKEETEKIIKMLLPKEAGLDNIEFDEQRSIVVLNVKNPSMAIGENASILKEIKKQTCWTPQVKRSPAVRSRITEAIIHVLYASSEYRKKFLNKVGKAIYKGWTAEKKQEWIRVSFLGGARQVGRSCLLLQTPESKIIIDCGIDVAATNSEKFPYLNVPEFDIKDIDAVIISHAHLDHSGLVPYLFKLGYRGPVYMTAPTRDIAALLALDYIGVSYKQAAQPIFSVSDIKEMVKHTITLNYGEVTDIAPDVRLTFFNAGHALGSSLVHLNIGNGLHNVLYTGDFKYSKTRLFDPPRTKYARVETLIMESTYGGRNDVMPPRKQSEKALIENIARTIKRKGKVLIPVLGVGRSQEVMLIIDDAIKQGLLQNVPVYIDGMVWDVTTIHTAYPEFLGVNVRKQIIAGENPFLSETFKRVGSPTEREEVINSGPCIILATSGMLVGGASVEYFRELADNKKNMIIFVSYQGVNSLGRQVQEGLKEARFVVEGKEEKVPIKLEVVSIEGLSGHSDRNQLINFVNNLKPTPRRIIINHGEQSKSLDLASTLHKFFKIETTVPRNLEVVRLR